MHAGIGKRDRARRGLELRVERIKREKNIQWKEKKVGTGRDEQIAQASHEDVDLVIQIRESQIVTLNPLQGLGRKSMV